MTQPAAPPTDDAYGLDRVYLGGEVCKWLYVMKGRLQMDEGAICRMAICLSLGERYAPDPSLLAQEGGKLFSVASLAGPPLIGKLLFAFLRQRMCDDGLDPSDEVEVGRQFCAYLSRGMLTLGVRVKHLADVGRLVEEAQNRFRQSHPGTVEADLDQPAPDEAAQDRFDARFGGLTPEAEPAERTGEVGATGQQFPREGTTPLVPGGTGSLWGTLLPPPVEVNGASRSTRKKRGVTSERRRRRKRR